MSLGLQRSKHTGIMVGVMVKLTSSLIQNGLPQVKNIIKTFMNEWQIAALQKQFVCKKHNKVSSYCYWLIRHHANMFRQLDPSLSG